MFLYSVRYPPVEPGSPGLGVGAHKDGGGLTLLAQDNTGGLQVQNWSGEWINVEPKAYALVINVGQVMYVHHIFTTRIEILIL